ncbi:DUF5677 domain-containing protein [Streptomyces sp. NPDC091299]|uniref:DUF5677 domain-containing protein n=1 Tax=Streptomyces sp. NPDC091299 TaxID=3155302 RepID=UPI003419D6D5
MPEDLTVEHERAYKGLEALARLVEDSSGALQPAGEDARPFFVAWGMLANVHRQAAAVVLLHRQGFGHETAPNRRSMLEHAAQVWWLAEDGPDAVDSMNHALQYKQRKLREATDSAGITYDTTIVDAAVVLPRSRAQTYNNMGHLLQRIGAPLHAIYAGESLLSHATLTSAERFYAGVDAETVHLLSEPQYPQHAPSPDGRAPYIALVLTWFAMSCFNQLLAGQPWSAELQLVARETGIEDIAAHTNGAH